MIVAYSEWRETFALKWKQNIKDFRLIVLFHKKLQHYVVTATSIGLSVTACICPEQRYFEETKGFIWNLVTAA